MSDPLRNSDTRFTYRDYLSWDEGERWEIIDGVAWNMSPAPSVRHQRVLTEILRQIANHLEGKPCEVFPAPFDVRLPEGHEADGDVPNVVQPDITVVCDPEGLDEKGFRGAPGLIVEILSPSSALRDFKQKLSLYERSGVPEYWIVHPVERLVEVFRMTAGGTYGKPDAYVNEDLVPSKTVEGLTVELSLVFRDSGDRTGG